jgi:acetoin utilization deacetylase AcuC-like enzyme
MGRSHVSSSFVRVFHCDRHPVPLPPGHRFPATKYPLLREQLLAEGTLREDELQQAPLATPEELLLVHTPGYVEALSRGTLTAAEERKLGFPWSELLVLRSRASVGGTLAAARAALSDGVAGNLAGGTHHAFAAHGEGYCVFNDHAVTARVLQQEGRISRALVVDLDVHQGNGTASIFAGDDSVFTFSMHGERNFPFHKARSSRDVELRDGCGDAEYLELLERHLPLVLEAADADLLLYQGGVDPLAEDALGRLRLTHEGLRARDRVVLTAARERDLPVVLTLGGGYARPIALSVEAHAGTWREAKAVFRGV